MGGLAKFLLLIMVVVVLSNCAAVSMHEEEPPIEGGISGTGKQDCQDGGSQKHCDESNH